MKVGNGSDILFCFRLCLTGLDWLTFSLILSTTIRINVAAELSENSMQERLSTNPGCIQALQTRQCKNKNLCFLFLCRGTQLESQCNLISGASAYDSHDSSFNIIQWRFLHLLTSTEATGRSGACSFLWCHKRIGCLERLSSLQSLFINDVTKEPALHRFRCRFVLRTTNTWPLELRNAELLCN